MAKEKSGLELLTAFGLLMALDLLLAIPMAYLLEYVFAPSLLVTVFGTATISIGKAWAICFVFGLIFGSKLK